MSNSSTLNGSVELLAKAMRQVFMEAVQEGLAPIHKDMASIRSDMEAMECRLNAKIDDGLNTTNQNVQAQLAQHRKDVASDVRRIVKQQLAG